MPRDSVSYYIDEEGTLVAQRDFEEVADRVTYIHPLWQRIHARLSTISSLQFQSTGHRGGPHPWAPSAPSTIDRKRRAGLRTKTMHATSDLRQSLVDMHDPHHVWRESEYTIEFGSDLLQFEIHQDEARVAAANIPYRPPIDLTATDEYRLTKLIEDYVVSGYARTAVPPE